ncbi:hypothetical protein ABZ714_08995 [Streptomyces sp. NPDC006798]|uniref:hypothetical protein n=1 Tax=Streptomyces sp. NPDC006798 TaxID=3155462 RepID=UPI0033EEE73B
MSGSEPLVMRGSELEPVPVEGCAICAAASNGRDRCRHRGDVPGVRKYSAMIEQHPHRSAAERDGAR